MWLTATMTASAAMAKPAAPAATLRVVPWWIYQDGGKLAVIADSSQRGDVRVISSKLLPRPVRMSKGSSLLVKIAGKTNRENTQLPCSARTSTISLTPLT